MCNRELLVRCLYEIGAVKEGNFTLSSGRTSNFYVDGRIAALHTKGLDLITEGIVSIITSNSLPFDTIGTMEGVGSGLILGGLLQKMQEDDLQGVVVRKASKDHGTKKMIEGEARSKILLIDDVATSGSSLLHVIKHIAPKVATAAIVVVDRGEGASEALARVGVKLYSILSMEDLKAMKPC